MMLGLLFILAGAAVLADSILVANAFKGICGALLVAVGIWELLPERAKPDQEEGQQEEDDGQNRGLQCALGTLLCVSGAISLYLGVTGGRWAILVSGAILIASGIIHFMLLRGDARG